MKSQKRSQSRPVPTSRPFNRHLTQDRTRILRLERLEDRSMLDGNPTLTLNAVGDVNEGEWFILSGAFSPPGVYSAVGERRSENSIAIFRRGFSVKDGGWGFKLEAGAGSVVE